MSDKRLIGLCQKRSFFFLFSFSLQIFTNAPIHAPIHVPFIHVPIRERDPKWGRATPRKLWPKANAQLVEVDALTGRRTV